MCGIAGFTGAKDPETLKRMLDSIKHRGPDDQSSMETDNFQIGMRRLSIIDLVTLEIYPVHNETNDIFAIQNGEIYNYQSLRSELEAAGHKFYTQSDSEVIVHAYEQWGSKFVEKLRGMFAIVIFDKKKDTMLLIRDRLGIKPLYYTEFDGRLIFASEIKAILAGFDIDRSPDDNVVMKFLLTRVHEDTKNTFFKNIKKVPAGHVMTIDNQGNFRLEKYWNPQPNSTFKSTQSDEYYAEALREKLLESMKLHLIADVPVGVNLSGGLDSSGVTSLASKLLREGTDLHTANQLYTFSAIHPGESIDETEYIDEVLRFTGAESFKIVPELEEFWAEIDNWVYFQEEPTISTAPYAYYTVMREAKKHVTVLLSGQGGDELFAGYIPYFMGYITSANANGAQFNVLRESIKGLDLYSGFIRQKLDTRMNQKKQLNVKGMLNGQAVAEYGANNKVQFDHKPNLNERLFEDLTSTTVPSLLRYEDKNSMANSIESRVPFLDHELVEFAFNLPIDQKIKHGWNRFVYRNAMKGLMPDKIRNRRSKIGFVNSEWEWLQAKAEMILEIFSSDKFRSRPYWDADEVAAEFANWVNGKKRGDGLMFWRILSTELWMRRFVDEFKVI